jgi:hypothetical protein
MAQAKTGPYGSAAPYGSRSHGFCPRASAQRQDSQRHALADSGQAASSGRVLGLRADDAQPILSSRLLDDGAMRQAVDATRTRGRPRQQRSAARTTHRPVSRRRSFVRRNTLVLRSPRSRRELGADSALAGPSSPGHGGKVEPQRTEADGRKRDSPFVGLLRVEPVG